MAAVDVTLPLVTLMLSTMDWAIGRGVERAGTTLSDAAQCRCVGRVFDDGAEYFGGIVCV